MASDRTAVNGPYLFVYGTLRPGHGGKGSRMMRKLSADAVHIGRGTVRGKLFRIGWYPGLVPSAKPDDTVTGDVFRLPRAGGLLAKLDEYEDASPGRGARSEYVRRRKVVRLDNGEQIIAWTYVYNRPVLPERRIEGGDFMRAVRKSRKAAGRASAKIVRA
jgi:gamma-glutamylcyclotransferase (GGCT)/AIG2-like uncharacterized protein YtfP